MNDIWKGATGGAILFFVASLVFDHFVAHSAFRTGLIAGLSFLVAGGGLALFRDLQRARTAKD
jgi:hypothetical protein